MIRRSLLLMLALTTVPGCGAGPAPAAGATGGAVLASARKAQAKDPALRAELLAMAEADQAARDADDPAGMAAVDARNTARLEAIVARRGWPGRSLVGEDGANAAWLIVQHADAAPAFQRRCLPLIEAAVARGEAAGPDYAYLVDRVALAAGEPQVYGTQCLLNDLGTYEPEPIADEDAVDARRKRVGLEPLATYLAAMNRGRKPLVVKDPGYRKALLAAAKAADAAPAQQRAQAEAVRALVRARGWPTASGVGQGAVDAAVRLAAEGGLDLAFLHELVEAQEAAFERQETSGPTLAYLVDRVLVREAGRQRYGTHFVWTAGRWVASPIADEAGVDARRARLGLGPLAAWLEVMKQAPPPKRPG